MAAVKQIARSLVRQGSRTPGRASIFTGRLPTFVLGEGKKHFRQNSDVAFLSASKMIIGPHTASRLPILNDVLVGTPNRRAASQPDTGNPFSLCKSRASVLYPAHFLSPLLSPRHIVQLVDHFLSPPGSCSVVDHPLWPVETCSILVQQWTQLIKQFQAPARPGYQVMGGEEINLLTWRMALASCAARAVFGG